MANMHAGNVRIDIHSKNEAKLQWVVQNPYFYYSDEVCASTMSHFGVACTFRIRSRLRLCLSLMRKNKIQGSVRINIVMKLYYNSPEMVLIRDHRLNEDNEEVTYTCDILRTVPKLQNVKFTCTMFWDESPRPEDDRFSSIERETKNTSDTSARRVECEHQDLEEDRISFRERGAKNAPNRTSFREREAEIASNTIRFRERNAKNASDTSGRRDKRVHQISKDDRFASRDRETKKALNTYGRRDECEDPDLEDFSILRENFLDLLLSGDDHDVVIAVKDKQFKAHRCVLRARSPVFEAMFRNQMQESVDGTVSIDDCEPEVFDELLRYVYTEKSDIQSASHAVGLYYAGDKYDLPRLQQKCVEFLKISLSTTAIGDVISMAARHGEEELLQQAIVYFSENIEEVMLTVEWQRFLIANPIHANEICLKAVRCLKKARDVFRFRRR